MWQKGQSMEVWGVNQDVGQSCCEITRCKKLRQNLRNFPR